MLTSKKERFLSIRISEPQVDRDDVYGSPWRQPNRLRVLIDVAVFPCEAALR
jgi:hypothetical protein